MPNSAFDFTRLLGAYSVLALVGILLTAWLWSRMARRDGRLTIIYFSGLGGAIVGAKLSFLFAEGWAYRDDWLALMTGRSITGALLGGYAAVETSKHILRYARATGDLFAIVVPVGIALGRVGCYIDGCCLGIACEPHWWTVTDASGVARWPAPAVEQLFNIAFLGWVGLAAKRGWLVGNRFHIYLIAYGLFRFGHEFLRQNTHWFDPVGGYQVLALLLVALGTWRLRGRLRENRKLPIRL